MTDLIVLPGLDGTATLHEAFQRAAAFAFGSVALIRYPTQQVLDYAGLERWIRPRLPDEEPFWLLGESFSGPIALSIAASPPPNLAGVILSTSFARSAVPLLKSLGPVVRMAPVQYAPMLLWRWLLLGRWATKPLGQALAQAISEVAPHVLQARAAMALQVDVSRLLASISLPLLYLRATEDRLLPASAYEPITSAVRRASKLDIEGPHLLLQARPDECARAIAGFVRASGT